MSKPTALAVLLIATIVGALGAAPAPESGVALDHVWIMVSPDAPERAALTRAGFQIAPDVSRHDGQGTASISVELDDAYIELMWPDAKVSVAPGLERAAEKFRQRMQWRTSGWCPFGIAFRRTSTSNEPPQLPFPVWTWTADWMPKGTVMEMLTPRDDTTSPALFIEPRALADPAEQAKRGALYHHPNGTHRLTAVQLTSPSSYEPIAAMKWLQEQTLLKVEKGDQWLMELTLDGGQEKKSKDLRPELPVVLRY
jgi:hypothetical protein